MRFYVDDKFFEIVPNAVFGIVIAKGIDNRTYPKEIKSLLDENIASCEEYYGGKKVKEEKEVTCYRDAMREMGFNPNKYMCSIEALLTRISKKKGFPTINPIVDLGNAISIKHKVPLGAHDINSNQGDFCVRPATEKDTFRPFGAGEDELDNPEVGEIVYASGNSIRTRRWTWRQSEIGKITEEVTDVFFPIDGFAGENEDEILAARDELAKKIEEIFGVKTEVGWVDINNKFIEF